MIEDSKSPMGAPLFFVAKKDGTQRMVIDYRKLNDITVKDAYPLPNMEELLEAARGAKVFSKFDLKFSYNLIRVRPEDKWKTAFITPWGLKQFTVLHYRFANAPPMPSKIHQPCFGTLNLQTTLKSLHIYG